MAKAVVNDDCDESTSIYDSEMGCGGEAEGEDAEGDVGAMRRNGWGLCHLPYTTRQPTVEPRRIKAIQNSLGPISRFGSFGSTYPRHADS